MNPFKLTIVALGLSALAAALVGVDWILDTSSYPARWMCGNWMPWLGWLHIFSDIGIWLSYLAVPSMLIYFTRIRDVPFSRLFWLFSAFIVFCGTTHLMEAIIFWWPAYGLAGLLKFGTAIVSIATAIVLSQTIPKALAFRSPEQLESEISLRSKELEKSR